MVAIKKYFFLAAALVSAVGAIPLGPDSSASGIESAGSDVSGVSSFSELPGSLSLERRERPRPATLYHNNLGRFIFMFAVKVKQELVTPLVMNPWGFPDAIATEFGSWMSKNDDMLGAYLNWQHALKPWTTGGAAAKWFTLPDLSHTFGLDLELANGAKSAIKISTMIRAFTAWVESRNDATLKVVLVNGSPEGAAPFSPEWFFGLPVNDPPPVAKRSIDGSTMEDDEEETENPLVKRAEECPADKLPGAIVAAPLPDGQWTGSRPLCLS